MRTTQRKVATLMRAARQALGLKFNHEVWSFLQEMNPIFAEIVSGPVTIGPYKNGSWSVFWISPEARQVCMPVCVEDLLDAKNLVRMFELYLIELGVLEGEINA